MDDPNLMLINFQTKEMNLKKVYEATRGNLSMLVGRSINLAEKYLSRTKSPFTCICLHRFLDQFQLKRRYLIAAPFWKRCRKPEEVHWAAAAA